MPREAVSSRQVRSTSMCIRSAWTPAFVMYEEIPGCPLLSTWIISGIVASSIFSIDAISITEPTSSPAIA